MVKMKPIAVEITSWQPYKEIIYKCANCGQDFRMFGDRERYCHTCGIEIEWHGIIKRLPESFNKNDYESEKVLIAELNRNQLN